MVYVRATAAEETMRMKIIQRPEPTTITDSHAGSFTFQPPSVLEALYRYGGLNAYAIQRSLDRHEGRVH